MKTISFTNKKKVVVVRSIAGLIADFADDVVARESNTLFLCAGNTGLGYGSRYFQDMELEYLEGICQKNDNAVCMIRGNHDNPLYFKEDTYKEYFKSLYDYLKNVVFIEDYTCVKTSRGNFLCIGGGIDPKRPIDTMFLDPSLNAKSGVAESTWFDTSFEMKDVKSCKETIEVEGKDPYETETNELLNFIRENEIKMILTHTAPGIAVDGVDTEGSSKEDSDNILVCRSYLTLLYSVFQTSLKYWFFSAGSAHSSDETLFNGTAFIPLTTTYENRFGTRELS